MASKAFAACALLFLCVVNSTRGMAEQFPDRPVKLVVGYSAGGPADAVARHLAAIVAKAWGQPVIVENKGGAAGSIAAATVARAVPDGYTLLYGTTDLIIGHIKTGKLVPLVTTGADRLTSLPQVPTVYEVDMPGLDLHAPWAGIFVPAATPRDRVMRINLEFAKARNMKETVEHPIFADSVSIAGTPEQFAAFVQSEFSRWATVIRAAGIKTH